jgi:hypothetical protein
MVLKAEYGHSALFLQCHFRYFSDEWGNRDVGVSDVRCFICMILTPLLGCQFILLQAKVRREPKPKILMFFHRFVWFFLNCCVGVVSGERTKQEFAPCRPWIWSTNKNTDAVCALFWILFLHFCFVLFLCAVFKAKTKKCILINS